MREIRIGVIGLGMIGGMQLEAARRVPGVRVVAVCGRDEDKIRAAAERLCVPRAYTDWRELVTAPDIDVVHNCTPNALHDEINRAAVLAGKHIYSEKPLSTDAKAALETWKLAQARGVAHGVNHLYRFHAALQEMRGRVQSGDCGRPLMVRGCYLQASHARHTDYNGRIAANEPSRALADIGVHWLDAACCMLGCRVASVMADLHTVHPERVDGQGRTHAVRNEDSASVMLRFADGTPGLLFTSKVSMGHKNDLRLCVDAEGYGIEWRQEDPARLHIGRREEPNETLYMKADCVLPQTRPYVTAPPGHVMGFSDAQKNALEAFYTSIRNKTYAQPNQPYATFEDGWHGVAFVEACLRSAREGRWVDLKKL